MLKRDMADKLYSIVINRYHEEHPEYDLTNEIKERIWYSLYGKLKKDGYEAAYEYARTAKLL